MACPFGGSRSRLYAVTPGDGPTFHIHLKSRDLWALERLRTAGAQGCTTIAQPAPRWSAYVFNLRQLGIEVETLHEPHGPPFPGHHARYVLRSCVEPVQAPEEVPA